MALKKKTIRGQFFSFFRRKSKKDPKKNQHTQKKMFGIFNAIINDEFERVKRIVKENPEIVHIKDDYFPKTLLDVAIAHGKLEIAKFLFEMGGRPNLDIYCDGHDTSVHMAAYNGRIETLKWVFKEKVLLLDVMEIKGEWKRTPLDCAIASGRLETANYLWEKRRATQPQR